MIDDSINALQKERDEYERKFQQSKDKLMREKQKLTLDHIESIYGFSEDVVVKRGDKIKFIISTIQLFPPINPDGSYGFKVYGNRIIKPGRNSKAETLIMSVPPCEYAFIYSETIEKPNN